MYNSRRNLRPATAATTPQATTIPYPIHPDAIMIPLAPYPPPSLPPFSGGGDGGGFVADEFPVRDERSAQWSYQETGDFVEIRAHVEWELASSKGKKNLWEMVVSRMVEKGYSRTVDQCKSKWKNLVSRYKGQEVSDLENGRECPFFYELHALFTARDDRFRQAQVDSEKASIKGKKRLEDASGYESHEEYSEEPENDDETNAAPEKEVSRGKRQRKGKSDKQSLENINKSNDRVLHGIKEMLRSFIQQQQRIDIQWKESMEKQAQERELVEQEWREAMEKLEREKMMMEQSWREREEQRRLREESRAERRDALLTTLLNKLVDEETA